MSMTPLLPGNNPFAPAPVRPVQLAPRAGSNPHFSLHRIGWVTATVRTVSGSVYVVVARKGFVTMVLAESHSERYSWQPQVGESYTGAVLLHESSTRSSGWALTLVDGDGEMVLQTSPIETIDVHEN